MNIKEINTLLLIVYLKIQQKSLTSITLSLLMIQKRLNNGLTKQYKDNNYIIFLKIIQYNYYSLSNLTNSIILVNTRIYQDKFVFV